MTLVRVLALVAVFAGLAVWLTVRPDQTAHAGTPPARAEVSYGDNTEEVALKRWQTGQARHWRYLMVQK